VINSRSLDELLPPAKQRAEAFLAAAKAQGIDLLVTSTYRDHESQTALYAQGRTKPGDVVTNAKAGESYHNYRCALDVVGLVNGKPVWNAKDPIWQKIGRIGKSCGLEWAGDWKGKMREFPHFQYTGGLTIAQLQAGAKIT
jgi:peptidoglycan L-alanyl-D-glutamate endopeptidase CwlK